MSCRSCGPAAVVRGFASAISVFTKLGLRQLLACLGEAGCAWHRLVCSQPGSPIWGPRSCAELPPSLHHALGATAIPGLCTCTGQAQP